jgi:hypothetical protein
MLSFYRVEDRMESAIINRLLLWLGRATAVSGVLICLVAGAARLSGQYWLGGFQLITLLQGGMALMIAACLCFLVLLTERGQR